MRLAHILFIGAILTASFEIALTVNVGSNLHIAQVLMMLIALAAVLQIAQRGRILWAYGCTAITLWVASQIALMPIAGNALLAVGFTGLLVLTVGGYLGVLQLYGQSAWFPSAMRWYLRSYVVLSVIGLLQFFLPLLHLPSFYVTQWFIHGRFARINGFNYEPSFYGTYILLGWVTLLDLRLSKAEIVSHPRWKYGLVIMTLALVLSSSRTAIVMVALELMLRVMPRLGAALRRSWRYFMQGRLVVPMVRQEWVLRAALIVAVVFAVSAFVASKVNPIIFLQGTGIGHTAAHSVVLRQQQFEDTMQVVRQYPFIGRGQAGVPVAQGANKGAIVRTFDDARTYEGFPVFVTAYAQSGLFAFLPFAVFLWQTSFGALRYSRRWAYADPEQARWLHALARSTIILYITLSVDQNLLRIYVWIHLAMQCAVGYRLRYAAGSVPARASVDASASTSASATLTQGLA